jgi:Fuc2NAc and GlcNAc transferase
MGDVFSGFIGFYFASITLYINNVLRMSVLIVPVLLSVFIYDATITLVKRILKKEKIWHPHSTHYYQKFAKKYGHKKVTVSVIIINIILFVPAYLIFIKPKFDLYIAFFTYLILFLSEFLLELKFLKDTPVKNRYI